MKNIYSRIGNPLNEEGIYEAIIEAYTDNYRLYNGLTKEGEKIKGRYTPKYLDDFYVYLFNDWKYTILKIREANYLKEPHRSKIIKLDDYLKRQNPSTRDEVMDILNGKSTQDKEINELINTFRWNKLGEYSSWEHIDSSYIRLGLHKRQKIEHRLYINCDSTKTHLITKRFIEKCKEYKINYYFKYDPYGNRADTIVIYCDTKQLPYYVKILNEIIKEENLTSSIHRPPLLTGKINPYIGYGSEPQEINGVASSFNLKREEHLEKCIREVTADFVKENLGRRMIKRTGEQLTYKDYLIDSIIAYLRENTIKYMSGTDKDIDRRGYTVKEVNSSFFDVAIINAISPRIEEIIKQYKEGNCKFKIEVPFSKGKILISELEFEDIIKKHIKNIFRKTKSYKERLKTKIISTAHEYDIDPENYAIDLSKCSMLGKGVEEFSSAPKVEQVTVKPVEEQTKVYTDDKPKIKKKIMNYEPMTDDEIEESKIKLGFKK